MNKEQMRREKLYQATMSLLRGMLAQGLVSKEEYAEFDTIFRDKYLPILGGLFSDFACYKAGSE